MSVSLLPLCSIPKIASRDGLSGQNAHIILPFYSYGFYFFSGQQYTFPNGTLPQDMSPTINGNSQVNTFKKDCCTCGTPIGDNITYVAP